MIIINNIPSNFFCFLLSNEFLFATSMICIYIKIIQSLLRFQIDLSLYVRKIDRKRYVGSTTRKAILLGILIRCLHVYGEKLIRVLDSGFILCSSVGVFSAPKLSYLQVFFEVKIIFFSFSCSIYAIVLFDNSNRLLNAIVYYVLEHCLILIQNCVLVLAGCINCANI